MHIHFLYLYLILFLICWFNNFVSFYPRNLQWYLNMLKSFVASLMICDIECNTHQIDSYVLYFYINNDFIYADLINHHRVELMVSEIQEIILYRFHCILRNDVNDEHVQVSVVFLQSLSSCNNPFSLLIMIQNLLTVLFLWPLTWAN